MNKKTTEQSHSNKDKAESKKTIEKNQAVSTALRENLRRRKTSNLQNKE